LRIFKRFLAGTSGLLAVCAFHMPYEAQAAYLPVSPTSGGTVICSPNQDGNYSVSGLDALSVNILSGAAINGTFSATDINVLDFLNSGNTNGLVTLSTKASLVFRNSGTINQGLTFLTISTRCGRTANLVGWSILFTGRGNLRGVKFWALCTLILYRVARFSLLPTASRAVRPASQPYIPM
jgi:hypothetical protein